MPQPAMVSLMAARVKLSPPMRSRAARASPRARGCVGHRPPDQQPGDLLQPPVLRRGQRALPVYLLQTSPRHWSRVWPWASSSPPLKGASRSYTPRGRSSSPQISAVAHTIASTDRVPSRAAHPPPGHIGGGGKRWRSFPRPHSRRSGCPAGPAAHPAPGSFPVNQLSRAPFHWLRACCVPVPPWAATWTVDIHRLWSGGPHLHIHSDLPARLKVLRQAHGSSSWSGSPARVAPPHPRVPVPLGRGTTAAAATWSKDRASCS